MARKMLSDRQWKRIQKLLPPETGQPHRPYSQSHRSTIEGILWIARTGAPWRDLPVQFGKWNSVYRRFRRWVDEGIFDRVFDSLRAMTDLDVVMMDGTFVKVHQHGHGAPKEGAHPRNHGWQTPLESPGVG